MENYDQRRRQNEERERARFEDRGRDRDSWWQGRSHDDDPPRRERGWLDYDRDYGRSGDRPGGREEQRYAQRGPEQRYGEDDRGGRSNFSPDWSREGAEPRYSDEQYYSRNRQRSGQGDSRRSGGESWQGSDDRSRWEQRAREAIPREQRELAERSERGDYYDPDWPYDRSGRGGEMQRSREEDQGSHYRGWYSRSTTPFSYGGGRGYLFSESLSLRGPYSGRGPKGYKRSDQQIIEEACRRLEQDAHVDASEIEVSAEEGIIRLRGTVPDRQTKRRAEECVESVYGARDVMNELRVERGDDQRQGLGSQGSQSTQASQSGRGMQGSQGAQASQGGQGQQASQGQQGTQPGTQGSRQGAGSPEQPGEGRSPRH
jgi:hypothetical protein